MKPSYTALCIFVVAAGTASSVYAQAAAPTPPTYRYSLSTTFLSFANVESEPTNLHHYEARLGYQVTPKDRVELKVATWKLFEPLGIPLWDPLFRKESEWYPGRLRESGLGVTYQRLLLKGLFAQVEVLPLKKTYLDRSDTKVGDGFKLYTSYHLGYHLPLLGNRVFLEPQVHVNYWPIDSEGPEGFAEVENRWNNYFLFEPNVYVGVKF
jgi:hypothetical protein